jgi:HSP20 family protein
MITVVFKPRQIRPGYSISEDPLGYYADNRNFRPYVHSHTWRPATDIYETDETITVLVEIAGMKEENFSISMDHNVLTIQGMRHSPVEERRGVHQMEIPFGEFAVEIIFPMEVDLSAAAAIYNNGFLRVTLPKIKPTRIDLNRE